LPVFRLCPVFERLQVKPVLFRVRPRALAALSPVVKPHRFLFFAVIHSFPPENIFSGILSRFFSFSRSGLFDGYVTVNLSGEKTSFYQKK